MESNRCTYCHSHLSLTRDHIQPKSRGGSNSKDNIQPLCAYCNGNKGNLTELELEVVFADIENRGVWYEWERRYKEWYDWLKFVRRERQAPPHKIFRYE